MTTEKQPSLEKYLTPVAVLLGAIIIALAFAFGGGERPATPSSGEPVAVNIADVRTETSPSVGSENAPVTIAVWFDFQCSFCKQFEGTTLMEVGRDYVENGQVRIVYKDFQFLGQASFDTALYSRAVWEAAPAVWGEWFAQVMAGTGEATLSKAGLDAISSGLGIDTARVASLIESNRAAYQAAIDADRNEGQAFGITGTPGTIIGTTMVGGAQPYATVKGLIDAELAN